jgi:hypothetical protein
MCSTCGDANEEKRRFWISELGRLKKPQLRSWWDFREHVVCSIAPAELLYLGAPEEDSNALLLR